MHRLLLCSSVAACWSSANPDPAAPQLAPPTTNLPAALEFAGQGHGYVWLESDLATEPPHGPERVLDSINGSTGTFTTMIADLPEPGPPATYTVVLADRACVVHSTTKRAIVRSANSPGFPGPWSLVAALEPFECHGRGDAELVKGAWPGLRLVEFGQGPNYSGGEGSHGEPIAAMAEWPVVEQQAYTRGPGFSVMPMKSRELAWYADTAQGYWHYRLRDRRGTLLAEGTQTAVLRLGRAFYVNGKRMP